MYSKKILYILATALIFLFFSSSQSKADNYIENFSYGASVTNINASGSFVTDWDIKKSKVSNIGSKISFEVNSQYPLLVNLYSSNSLIPNQFGTSKKGDLELAENIIDILYITSDYHDRLKGIGLFHKNFSSKAFVESWGTNSLYRNGEPLQPGDEFNVGFSIDRIYYKDEKFNDFIGHDDGMDMVKRQLYGGLERRKFLGIDLIDDYEGEVEETLTKYATWFGASGEAKYDRNSPFYIHGLMNFTLNFWSGFGTWKMGGGFGLRDDPKNTNFNLRLGGFWWFTPVTPGEEFETIDHDFGYQIDFIYNY